MQNPNNPTAGLFGFDNQASQDPNLCYESDPYLKILRHWAIQSGTTYSLPTGVTPNTQITKGELAKMLTIAFGITATTPNDLVSIYNISPSTICVVVPNTSLQILKTQYLLKENSYWAEAIASCGGSDSDPIFKAHLAKMLVNAYEFKYQSNNNSIPNARLGAAKNITILGDKKEFQFTPTGSTIPITTESTVTMVSGQQRNFVFPDVTIDGQQVSVYWSVDGGTLTQVGEAPYFQSIKWTAPNVASQQTFHLYYYATTAGGYATETVRDIIVNPSGTPPTTTGVSMQLSAGSLNFGSVAVNATADRTLTITNPAASTGSLIGSITLPATSTGFSPMVGSTSFNLAPGQSSNLTLRFQPTSGGSFNAPVTITHNAGNVSNPVSVSLLGVGTTGTQTPTLNCTGAIPLTCEVTYNGTTTGGTNNVSQYGENGTYLPISESGPEKVHTFTASTTGTANFVFSETAAGILDIFVLNTCGSTINTIARAGGGTNVRGSFNVVAGQTYYLVVDGENGANGSYSLKVECPAGSSGSGGGTSCATVNKTSIDFGLIGTGSYGGQYFTISNPTNQYAQGWVRFVGQHGSKFGVFVPGVGYLTEYQYSLNLG